jgi:thiol:disulfide interchange protein DsbC
MKRILAALVGLGLAFSVGVFAGDDSSDAMKDKIAKALGIDRNDVRPSPVNGWFEVQHDHDFGYVSSDGKFLLRGDLVDMDTGESLTENRRRADRLAALKNLGSDNLIEFAPTPPIAAKYVITVFTDLDCPYCRKLHSQIFPRHGLNSPTYFQAISVWCSADRQGALTRAKLGQNIPTRKCDNPVDKEYKLALDLGIAGTPGIVLPDGTLYPGYASPDEMVDILVKSEAADKAAAAASAKSKG